MKYWKKGFFKLNVTSKESAQNHVYANKIRHMYVPSCKNPAPIWNDSKPKNCWYYLIDADAIAFFMASKGKKVNKKTNKKQN